MKLSGTGQASQMKSAAAYFGPGDVLYGRLRPYLNKIYKPDFEGLASGEFIIFPCQPNIDNGYLQYFLNSWAFVTFATRLNTGDRPRVDFDQVSGYPFPLPPLPEQRRIVAEIEKHFTRLDAAVASLQRARANLKRYRASELKAACEGRLVPTEAELARREGRSYESASVLLERILKERRARWDAEPRRRGKYQDPQPPDTSNLPTLPEDWAWATLPQLGELNRGKSKHRPRNAPKLYGGQFPFIQTGDIKRSGGMIREYSQTYNEVGLAQSRLWPAGTLCITIAANIAETGILTFPACFPDSVVGLVHCGEPTTVRFVDLFLRTQQGELERFAPATAQRNINLDVLFRFPVPFPPFAEQQRIVAEVERHLSVIQASENVVEANLKRAERLRQAILQLAFQGKLVPQDPTDEPASALLERIRAERENKEQHAYQR